jgi:hypothetical protein
MIKKLKINQQFPNPDREVKSLDLGQFASQYNKIHLLIANSLIFVSTCWLFFAVNILVGKY